MIAEIRKQKQAYLNAYDALTMFRECGDLEESERGIKCTLHTAMMDDNISLMAYISLVKYAYFDV